MGQASAGSRCVAQRRLEALLAPLSMPWDTCGDICFPNLLEPWCILTIPCKRRQWVLAGEGGAGDTEAVRWWLPHSPCHITMEKAGRGGNSLGVQEKPQGHVLDVLRMLALLELDLHPRVIQITLNLGQHSQRCNPIYRHFPSRIWCLLSLVLAQNNWKSKAKLATTSPESSGCSDNALPASSHWFASQEDVT